MENLSEEMTERASVIPHHYKEIVAGCFAGILQVYAGQPFDMVKVRMQSMGVPSSPFSVASDLVKREGTLAFYKGSTSPLLGISFIVSIQFATNEAMKRKFTKANALAGDPHPQKLTDMEYFISGVLAGCSSSPVASVVEHVRIRMQVQTGEERTLYRGCGDAVKDIYSRSGVGGVCKGMLPTILRDSLAYGISFYTYERLKSIKYPLLVDGT